uniref:Uncharacterized protein n=1 Tax=Rhizophagus irregularis (strain DAOM 181602 / DAOM 197198 / MUCL 43194) TaxID=747089 RepID=U9UPS5_RHIID
MLPRTIVIPACITVSGKESKDQGAESRLRKLRERASEANKKEAKTEALEIVNA